MLERSGCADFHYRLQDCMLDHKDWRKCQEEVRAFKECMDTKAAEKAKKDVEKSSWCGSGNAWIFSLSSFYKVCWKDCWQKHRSRASPCLLTHATGWVSEAGSPDVEAAEVVVYVYTAISAVSSRYWSIQMEAAVSSHTHADWAELWLNVYLLQLLPSDALVNSVYCMLSGEPNQGMAAPRLFCCSKQCCWMDFYLHSIHSFVTMNTSFWSSCQLSSWLLMPAYRAEHMMRTATFCAVTYGIFLVLCASHCTLMFMHLRFNNGVELQL